MRRRRRRERIGDPNVELVIAAREPHPAAPAERFRLGQLGEAEQLAIKPPRIGFGSGGRRDLDVIEADRSQMCGGHRLIIARPLPAATASLVDLCRWRYVLGMTDEHKTEELKVIQSEREADERNRAKSAFDEDEAEQHERRADKARYLREKLEERAESERRLKE
jgi:hypothetical protein